MTTTKNKTPVNTVKHRLMLVDDHPMVRERLAQVINAEPDLMVCGEADSHVQAMAAMQSVKPGLVIVDLTLKDSNGLNLVKDLAAQHPHVAVLVLSMHDEAHYVERSLRAGARGYITKQEATRKILEAIRAVLAGEVYVTAALKEKVFSTIAGLPQPNGAGESSELSKREMEVLDLIGRGLTTLQMADKLRVSVHSIDTYRMRIKGKLGFNNSSELLQYAIRWVLSHDEPASRLPPKRK